MPKHSGWNRKQPLQHCYHFVAAQRQILQSSIPRAQDLAKAISLLDWLRLYANLTTDQARAVEVDANRATGHGPEESASPNKSGRPRPAGGNECRA